MIFNKGTLYKLKHNDIQLTMEYNGFVALTNCIIFCPSVDISSDISYGVIPCDFLITFDKHLRFNDDKLTTGFSGATHLSKITKDDIELLVKLCKENNYLHRLSQVLLTTEFRYNRKLDKIIKYKWKK